MTHNIDLIFQLATFCLIVGGILLPALVHLIGSIMDRKGWKMD